MTRDNEVAPTLDLSLKIAVSLNRGAQLATGMVFVEASQPHIQARIPFQYDVFSDVLKLPDDVDIPAWRGLIKALIRYHAHVFETATDHLVEFATSLLNPGGEEMPPPPSTPPGPATPVGH